MEVNIPTETTTEFLITYGLYFGALFQLLCIAAVVLLDDKVPESPTYGKSGDLSEEDSTDGSGTSTPKHTYCYKLKKQDKKKRR